MEARLAAVVISVIATVAGFVFSKFMSHIIKSNELLKKYIDSKLDKVDESINMMDEKIDRISERYNNVFDELFIKFSNWEERIKRIVDGHSSRDIGSTGNNNYIDKALEFEIRELDSKTKNDIEKLKSKIKSVSVDLSLLSGKLKGSEKIESYYKNFKGKNEVNEILLKIKEIDELHTKHYESVDNNSRKIFTICQKIVKDYKEVIKEIDILKTRISSTSNKIQFISGKKKK